MTKVIYCHIFRKVVKERIAIRVDEEELKFIDELIAKKIFETRSQFIRKAIREYLKKFEEEFLA